MRKQTTGFWLFLVVSFSVPASEVLAAHILEPIGTEIAATAPRGRMFGQAIYDFQREETGTKKNTHRLPLEFEIGLGERTQLNLEAELLLREDEAGSPGRESGIEEMAFGVKHRFLDETPALPDAAFEVEYAPSVGLDGDERGLKGGVILSKHLNPLLALHLNGFYELETDQARENKGAWLYNVAPVFRLIPDRLLLLAELNGKTEGSGRTELLLGPEVIGVIQTETFFALQNLAFKLGVPIGLNDHSADWGVRFAISKLF